MIKSITTRNVKRIFAVLLAITLVFTAIPTSSFTSYASVSQDAVSGNDAVTDGTNESGAAVSGNTSTDGTVSGSDSKPIAVIAFEEGTVVMEYGKQAAYIASGQYGSADSYSSSDVTVATVDNSGLVTPVGIGTTTITATISESAEYLSSTAKYELTIVKGTQDVLQWSLSVPESITWLDTFTNVAEGGNSEAIVTYRSSDEEVAVVDQNGLVTPEKPGTVEIIASKAGDDFYNDISAQYTLVITKADQEALVFVEKNPNAIYYGDTYSNAATGGSISGGAVLYSSSDDSIAKVDEYGTITALKSGDVTITATMDGDDFYNSVSESYNIHINRADQSTEFIFEKGDGVFSIVYGDEFANGANGGENTPIKYESSDITIAEVDAEGKVTAHKAGEVTIIAINPEDDRFNEKRISYDLVIERADQTVAFEKADTEIPVITCEDVFENPASAKSNISYSSSDESIAKVDENGNLEIITEGKVTITAVAEKDNCYNEASASYTIEIVKADQEITFTHGLTPQVVFNDNDNLFENSAESNKGDIDCIYSIVSGSELIVDFDVTDGSFTICGAGEITINVVFSATPWYKMNSLSYTLTVEPDDQEIAFEDDFYELFTGEDFDAPAAVEQGERFGTGSIRYSIKTDSNNVIKSLDEETGAVELTYNAGEVVISAAKSADKDYNEAIAEYTLKVSEWVPESVLYQLNGDKKNNSGWFTGNVSVKAEDGYLLSYDKANDGNAEKWQSILEDAVTEDADDNQILFYVKDKETGHISSVQNEAVKKDETYPTASVEVEELTIWDKFLTFVGSGQWTDGLASFVIKSDDSTSGVASVEYFIDYVSDENAEIKSEAELDEVTGWNAYTGDEEALEKDLAFIVYAKVTDTAGNYQYASTNGIVFEETQPVIEYAISNTAVNEYYNEDVEIQLNITDPGVYSGIDEIKYWVVKADDSGEEQTQEETLYQYEEDDPKYDQLISKWSSDENEKNIIVDADLNYSDNVTVYVSVTDNAENQSIEEIKLKICPFKPEIKVKYIDDGSFTSYNGVDYYSKERKAKVSISGREEFFKEPAITISAKDVLNKDVVGTYEISDWNYIDGTTDEDSVHEAYITFSGSANYEYTVEFTNTIGTSADKYVSEAFTVDLDVPESSVDIDGNVWTSDEAIEELTFKLWNQNAVSVKIEASDTISPIALVEYYITDRTEILDDFELETASWEAVEAYKTETEFQKGTEEAGERFTVYVRVTDVAGQQVVYHSDGYIVDPKASTIEAEYEPANENGYHNDDITVSFTVEENEIYSGIDTITYWVECDGNETQRDELYNFDVSDPSYEELTSVWSSEENDNNIVIDSKLNNSDKVVLYIQTVDNAGNECVEEYPFSIDIVAPEIELTYVDTVSDSDAVRVEDGRGYFAGTREAHLVIVERTSSFDGDEALEVFKNSIKNGSNEIEWSKVEWSTTEGETPDEARHEAIITFENDYNYTIDENALIFTDKADNKSNSVDTKDSLTPYLFTVDVHNPSGYIFKNGDTWEIIKDVLTFDSGKFDIEITAKGFDETSPVDIYYYKTDSHVRMLTEELDKLAEGEWSKYDEKRPIKISDDEKIVVYLKVIDYAGNSVYVTSNGYILDTVKSEISLTPETPVAVHNGVGVYNDDIDVTIQVTDAYPYAGIDTVEYWITCDNVETFRETLLSKGSNRVEYEELVSTFEETITVSAEDNNSCNVVVHVKVVDRAGNESLKELPLDIDITHPTIDIAYDNNTVKKSVTVSDSDGTVREYYDAVRIATVKYTERTGHFSKENAIAGIKITAVDAKGDVISVTDSETNGSKVFESTDIIGEEWITVEGDSADAATHTVEIGYTLDANYSFEISYTDLAQNKNEVSDEVKGTKKPYLFTVDTVEPEISVTLEEIDSWERLLDFLTFEGGNNNLKVTKKSSDVTSPHDVYYYKTENPVQMKIEELKTLPAEQWILCKGDDIEEMSEDEQFVFYLRAVDYAGNDIYINSDGYILDTVKSEILFTPETPVAVHNGVGVYNDDVDVTIQVTDAYPYAGIDTVEYWITCDNVETFRETLLSKGSHRVEYKELVSTFEETITVSAEDNNSCYVVVHVKVVDRAGNESLKELPLDIDITHPTIDITYDNNTVKKSVTVSDSDGAVREYYDAVRIATVKYTERTGHFSKENAIAGIEITAVDAKGDVISVTDSETNGSKVFESTDIIGEEWITVEGDSADAATHTVEIGYTLDANYSFEISYTDLAQNKNEVSDEVKGTKAPYLFTVDTTEPEATITVDKFGYTWDELEDKFDFHLATNEQAEVLGSVSDKTSPIESVHYYKTDSTVVLERQELESISDGDWLTCEGMADELKGIVTVDPNERFTVYKRIVDYAGNTEYISTNGVILDNVKPQISISLPTRSNGFYTSNVDVQINVKDPVIEGDVYSGIKEIGYVVSNNGSRTQGDILYDYEKTLKGELSTFDKLTQSVNKKFTVDATKNNSNNVKITVYAVDNAGNRYEKSETVMIDITKPTIKVSYDNNAGDTSFGDTVFFKENRVATITITERNFAAGNVNVEIMNEHGTIPQISGWSNSGSGDSTTHTATVVFSEDGDYTFDISCADVAGNSNDGVNYDGSLAPQKFTIDKTLPVIEVSYDNNEAANENYYNADRVATISVTEHNFETSRMQISVNATDNGRAVTVPSVSGWTSYGDVHTATISYSSDALYTFDIDYADKAGNQAVDFAEQRFYVDKTNPIVEISQITDKSANNSEGNIGFVITAQDTNFDVFTPMLSVVVKNGDTFETRQLQAGNLSNIANGKVYTVTNLESDGIYSIKCTVVDKAGNAYSEVTLYDKNGNPYVEERSGEDTLLMFSVNRDGSTYAIDEITADIVEKYYVQEVPEDLSIIEINTDILDEYSVTLNGQELAEGKDYQLIQEGGEGEWVKYSYIINRELFENEGEYRVVVSSKDQAGNNAFSDVKDASINFVVDKTAPIVTITGLAVNGRYQVEKQLVTLIPSDDGGALRSLIVRLVDEDGNVIEELINLTGEALTEALENNEGKITFEIEEGLYQNVQIICDDYAVDENGNTNIYDNTFTNVSVSTSSLMIFWANKPLRYGTIIGVLGIVFSGILLILLKRRKKNEEE